jgi:hypothetical protein
MCLETPAALELHLGLVTEAEANLRGQSASVAVAATDDSALSTYAYDLYIYEPDTGFEGRRADVRCDTA